MPKSLKLFNKKIEFAKDNNLTILTKFNDYINNRQNLDILCNNCNKEFKRTWDSLYEKKRIKCPWCQTDKKNCNGKKLNEEFIEKANLIHNKYYDYSLVEYKNNHEKVTIICPIHGKFQQNAIHHINEGKGCRECGYKFLSKTFAFTKDKFIEKANEIHGNKYDYSNIDYTNSKTKIQIYCNQCKKYFCQMPYSHLFGKGCKNCMYKGSSSSEKEIYDWLSTIYKDKIEKNNRNIISPKEIDIYLPDKKFGIEYNGLYWHSEINKNKKLHINKTIECKKQNINLFHVFSDEWINKKEIIKSMIAHRIGLTQEKIHARKCEIRQLTKKETNDFFRDNHISGPTSFTLAYGLIVNNEICSAISLREPFHKKYKIKKYIEIARFANKINSCVVGGFDKLLSNIILNIKNKYRGILSYADLRFGDGAVYLKSGFNLIGQTPIDYWYTDFNKRENRFKYKASNGKSESDVAKENNVHKIYGCGSNIYILGF